ncbi:MAG TPA: Rrf2 family transcriptional regulator [Kiloniellales bacterium]|nr:Rrf2 family transcriptional regulator [Kiloniellales bacterium]
MLRLSKKLLFAIEAVVDVAYHAGNRPVRSTDISDRQGIPRRYLEQVLQELVHEGVLAGQRGPRGGYRLARDGSAITLGEIIRIVRRLEGQPEPSAEPGGSQLGQRVVRPIWNEMQDEMMNRLDRLTVAELCRRARTMGIEGG